MINNPVVSSAGGGGSSLPELREVTAKEFLEVNKGLMLAFHRDFVCGVPYGETVRAEANLAPVFAFINKQDGMSYRYFILFGNSCAVADESTSSLAGVDKNGELHMQGNFYDVKLFEVVE